jgi:hypothetical protein
LFSSFLSESCIKLLFELPPFFSSHWSTWYCATMLVGGFSYLFSFPWVNFLFYGCVGVLDVCVCVCVCVHANSVLGLGVISIK